MKITVFFKSKTPKIQRVIKTAKSFLKSILARKCKRSKGLKGAIGNFAALDKKPLIYKKGNPTGQKRSYVPVGPLKA